MRVQRIKYPDGKTSWTVLDNNFYPVQPICQYLKYLSNLERSPNTIQNYARHLRLFWEFLDQNHLDWKAINLEKLSDFIHWLRRPDPSALSIQTQEAKRTESTINIILSAVCSFYDFQFRLGNVGDIRAYSAEFQHNRRYKPFLHHLSKGKPTQTRLLKLKVPKRQPKTLTPEQITALIAACHTLRDKFLLCLLYESGMRIGQALGLRHEDVRSWDNEIEIVYRTDNANGALAKGKEPYTVHVSKELMGLYSDYLSNEYPLESGSDYVFVNLKGDNIGAPLKRDSIQSLFERLQKVTGIDFHPHILRHTHATELIRNGWEMAYVQKRLGHASIYTTMNSYTHLDNDDLKNAYKDYLEKRGQDQDDQS
jgi:integrase